MSIRRFRNGRLGRIRPLGIAYAGYQLWRRLSPQQKQAIKTRAGNLATQIRGRRVPPVSPAIAPHHSAEPS